MVSFTFSDYNILRLVKAKRDVCHKKREEVLHGDKGLTLVNFAIATKAFRVREILLASQSFLEGCTGF